MFYQSDYDYQMIDETSFDMAYLTNRRYPNFYQKYILVYYQDGDQTREKKIVSLKEWNELQLNSKDLLEKYFVEEIDANQSPFSSAYSDCRYFHVFDIGFWERFLIGPDADVQEDNDNEEVKNKIASYQQNQQKLELDEKAFFEMP